MRASDLTYDQRRFIREALIKQVGDDQYGQMEYVMGGEDAVIDALLQQAQAPTTKTTSFNFEDLGGAIGALFAIGFFGFCIYKVLAYTGVGVVGWFHWLFAHF